MSLLNTCTAQKFEFWTLPLMFRISHCFSAGLITVYKISLALFVSGIKCSVSEAKRAYVLFIYTWHLRRSDSKLDQYLKRYTTLWFIRKIYYLVLYTYYNYMYITKFSKIINLHRGVQCPVLSGYRKVDQVMREQKSFKRELEIWYECRA